MTPGRCGSFLLGLGSSILEFAKLYNNSVSRDEQSSLQEPESSSGSGGSVIDAPMDAFKGMVGLGLLKSFARFV